MKIVSKLKTAGRLLREKGPDGVRQKLAAQRRQKSAGRAYAEWLKANALTEATRGEIKRQIAELRDKPLISIILPVYNVGENWLRRCLETVHFQLYENWELCIADDKSTAPHVAAVLNEFVAKDARVKVVFHEENGHISAASNSALALATGEFCVLLDHDDELSEDALFYVAKELNDHPETGFIYSDEDLIDENGRRSEPSFKPDFSLDLLYSLNMVTHLSAYRTDVLRDVGGFRQGFEGSQDYDLALRVIERIGEHQIRHIPKILYHWRAIQGSVALSADEKPYAHDRARIALQEHFERTGREATVERGIYQFHRVEYPRPDSSRLSVIRWSHSESQFLIENAGRDPIALESDSGQSIAAKLNEAASLSKGDVLIFLQTGVEPAGERDLGTLASYAAEESIGAVGGRVSDGAGRIVEAGLIVGGDDVVRNAHRGFGRDEKGSFFRLQVTNNYSAVSAVCFAVRRELFGSIGGFDADSFPESLFDIDFCFRLRAAGHRVVFTPTADFNLIRATVSARSASRAERELFFAKWPGYSERDPFYNPNLSRRGEPFKIV